MKLKKNYTIDVYGVKLTVVVTDDMLEASKEFKMQLEDKAIKYSSGIFGYFIDSPLKCYILLRDDCTPGAIAHEAFHMAAYIMDLIGSDLDRESEEPYAYLISCIVNKAHTALDLYNKKLES